MCFLKFNKVYTAHTEVRSASTILGWTGFKPIQGRGGLCAPTCRRPARYTTCKHSNGSFCYLHKKYQPISTSSFFLPGCKDRPGESTVGFEPTSNDFAERCLTAWLRGQKIAQEHAPGLFFRLCSHQTILGAYHPGSG